MSLIRWAAAWEWWVACFPCFHVLKSNSPLHSLLWLWVISKEEKLKLWGFYKLRTWHYVCYLLIFLICSKSSYIVGNSWSICITVFFWFQLPSCLWYSRLPLVLMLRCWYRNPSWGHKVFVQPEFIYCCFETISTFFCEWQC